MLMRVLSARALAARGLATALFFAFTFGLIGLSSSTAWSSQRTSAGAPPGRHRRPQGDGRSWPIS